MPLYGWSALQAIWSIVVPFLMDRELSKVAPEAPGRYRALTNVIVSLIGITDEVITDAELFDWYI